MAGLKEMVEQAVDLSSLGRRVTSLEERFEALQFQPAADAIGPNTFMTITPEGVVEEAEGPEGEEGPEGPPGEPGPPGKQGKEGPEGKQGKEGPEGKPAAAGTYSFFEVNWPTAEGVLELASFLPLTFQPGLVLVWSLSNSAVNTLVATTPLFGGRAVEIGFGVGGNENIPGQEGLGYELKPTAAGPFFTGPGPAKLRLLRSAEAAKGAQRIFVLAMSVNGFFKRNTGGGQSLKEEGGNTIQSNETSAATPSTLFHIGTSVYGSGQGLVSASDTVLTSGTVAVKNGTAHAVMQIFFPSTAEREAGTKHTFTRTYAGKSPGIGGAVARGESVELT